MSNINTTVSTAANTFTNKEYYDRKLLETAKTKLVHASFGQKRSIPKNSGKRVEFRRYELFTPDKDALELEEGVTPDGQSLSQSHVEATVKQYGAYVEVSDLYELTGFDNTVNDTAELLGEQVGSVVEWVTRDAMCAGTNVQYAGGKTLRLALTSADKLTVAEIRKAVRTLKKAKARMFTSTAEGGAKKPHFVCICSPDATYDLQSDALWQDVSKYSNTEQIYSGEIGRLFGVVFVESTEAKVFNQSVLTAVDSHSANSADVIVDAISDAAESYLVSGAKIKIGSTEYTVASCDKAAKKITLSAAVTAQIAADTLVYSEDAGALDANKKGLPVHATLVFGADAYGVIDVADPEGGALQTIIKPCGSAGASDPLNPRATVGAKVAAYTVAILNNLWLVRIEHAVTE